MDRNFLFLEPFEKEGFALKNRLGMTAMTRNFSDAAHNPTQEMLEYYVRRAKDGVGLILTEGTIIHPSADGYPNVPYIYKKEHVREWKKIVDAVHAEGTKIFCQLWHCGQISHPDYLGGALPVSASAIGPQGIHPRLKKPFVTPRALTIEEIPALLDMFAVATENALEAGFDGVEIHAGHGYLLDSFFDSRVNLRSDEYGGSIENRCRLPLMVLKRVLEIAGPTRTTIRISPSRDMNGIYEWPDMDEMLAYLIPQFETMGLKILDVSCARSEYFTTSGKIVRSIRPLWPHVLMAGASLAPEEAEEEIRAGLVDIILYGRFLIANPDFVTKIRRGESLVPYDTQMLKSLI